LQHVGAGDWHRPSVDLDHEAPARPVVKPDSENEVGDNTDVVRPALMRDDGPQCQRIPPSAYVVGKAANQLFGGDEPNPSVPPGGKLQSYRKLEYLQLMFDKGSARSLIVATYRGGCGLNATLDQEPCPAVRKRIDHGSGAVRRVVVEL